LPAVALALALAGCSEDRPGAAHPEEAQPVDAGQSWPTTPLVYRQAMVGYLPYPNSRVTWTLRFAADATTLSRVYARGGAIRIDQNFGKASFVDVSTVVFAGIAIPPPYDHLRLFLKSEGDAGGTLDLRCNRATVPAMPADAWLQTHGQDEAATWTAKPRPISVLRCKDAGAILGVDSFEADRGDGAGTLEFAEAPGVEWIFENSDMVAQTGGYRLLPPSPH
jgi:hypothetical protein